MRALSSPLVLLLALSSLPAGAQTQIATFPGPAPGVHHSVVLGGEDLNGDGFADVVVGAPDDDTAGVDAGAVYAYSGKTGALLWAQYGNVSGAAFGHALAYASDLTWDTVADVLVGAPYAQKSPGNSPGHVQLLSGITGAVFFTGWGISDGDRMGWSVAGGIDYGGTKLDFAGGAPFNDTAGTDAGQFVIWAGEGSGLVTFGFGKPGDRLGWSLSAIGDVDSDGRTDLIVGAPYADTVFQDVGEAIIVSSSTYTVLFGLAGGDQFGWSVASAGDLDGDGVDDVFVGAPGNDDNGADAGRVRAFRGVDGFQIGVWRGDGAGDRFGSSLAQLDNLDGDFHLDWAVGATQAGVGAGYVRVFSGGYTPGELFTLRGDAHGDEFGSSLSRGGYAQGNFTPAIAVGARSYDGPVGTDTGMARLYTGACPGLVSYCTAGVSASGCQATLSAVGTPSASAGVGFTLTSTNVEGGKDGLFFFGWNGRQAVSWGNGSSFQCVAPPVKRGGVLWGLGSPGTCTGSFQQDLNQVFSFLGSPKNPGPGAVVQAQLWYRDPSNTSNMTTSLSDAIEFALCP